MDSVAFRRIGPFADEMYGYGAQVLSTGMRCRRLSKVGPCSQAQRDVSHEGVPGGIAEPAKRGEIPVRDLSGRAGRMRISRPSASSLKAMRSGRR